MHYLDYAATTPVPAQVAEVMVKVLTEDFGNPSAQYPLGRAARGGPGRAFLFMQQRDAKPAPQAGAFRPPCNSPSGRHFTRRPLLCVQ